MECDTPSLLVETDDSDLRDRVCKVASEALSDLSACHLKQESPIVFVFEDLILELGNSCLGLYHRKTERIVLLTPDAFETAHAASDFCDFIPASAHFDSIVVHELTHALVDQTPNADAISRTDDEFIAYAMQVQSMPAATRGKILERYGPQAADRTDRINGYFLDIAPLAFAAASWLHFTAPGNGCGLVGKILSGEFTFRRPFP